MARNNCTGYSRSEHLHFVPDSAPNSSFLLVQTLGASRDCTSDGTPASCTENETEFAYTCHEIVAGKWKMGVLSRSLTLSHSPLSASLTSPQKQTKNNKNWKALEVIINVASI